MQRIFWLGLLWLLSACAPVDFSAWLGEPSGSHGPVEWVDRDWPSGGHYEGELLNGKRHGKGTFTWPDGARYIGEYRMDERTGYGIFTWPNGSRYEGQFVGGKREGKGAFIWPDGARYVGEYRHGERHGQGSFYSADKSVVVCQAVPQEESQDWMDGRLLGSSTVSTTSLPPPGSAVSPAVMPPPVSAVAKPLSPVEDIRTRERNTARFALPPDFDTSPPATTVATGNAPASGKAESSPPAATFGAAKERSRLVADSPASSPASSAPETRDAPGEPREGQAWREPRTGMTFVRVPGGCFQMGGMRGGLDERPPHAVCVDSFWLGRYEVTREEWEKIMGPMPVSNQMTVVDRQRPRHDPREPMESVSWFDVQQYISRLDQASGAHFRLPTEAEWEYACRSGGREQLYCGDDQPDRVAWYDGNNQGAVHPVGSRSPNGLGLYDMSGNVWEWVADWYEPEYYSLSAARNPTGPSRGEGKVFRGGSWLSGTRYIRATQRYRFPPDRRYNLLGFRLVNMP
ncbi:MAG: SUMF1/EgtB/PvdO family nonheme iron enzyme [Magnetococcales bacterium]|nr:SUMF1/EgtB/PvdO family nonheme iron enzyme [Magnetococcales bacterium]